MSKINLLFFIFIIYSYSVFSQDCIIDTIKFDKYLQNQGRIYKCDEIYANQIIDILESEDYYLGVKKPISNRYLEIELNTRHYFIFIFDIIDTKRVLIEKEGRLKTKSPSYGKFTIAKNKLILVYSHFPFLEEQEQDTIKETINVLSLCVVNSLKETEHINTCIVENRLEEENGDYFINLIKSDRCSYLLDTVKSVSVIRYEDTCKTGYQVIITVANLNYGSKDFALKLISRFKNDSITNLRLKAWNYITMINQGENNLFICVEDRYYKDKWEDLVLKHLNF
ncbi:MAG: hypothetical protein SO179_02165 [Bacteroidales bacterium]|nr:hypothetical protein [Bacteroidales bacterium]